MKLNYQNSKIQKLVSDNKKVVKRFGIDVADKIYMRLQYLKSTSTLKDVSSDVPIKRHKLTGNYKNHFAIKVNDKLRIIFKPNSEFDNKEYRLEEIDEINLVDIKDYHE